MLMASVVCGEELQLDCKVKSNDQHVSSPMGMRALRRVAIYGTVLVAEDHCGEYMMCSHRSCTRCSD